MKIAIHNIPNKDRFSSYWVKYCEEHNIPFKIVNCFDSDIIAQLEDCSGLMFHFFLGAQDKMLFAKQLLYSVESSGKKVFPDFRTMWHYDDKLGQKYLLESIKAPLVPTYVFFQKEKALEWANSTQFPKVFKLRNGASSSNVKLVKHKDRAINLIDQAFGRGFKHQGNAWPHLKERIRKYKMDSSKWSGVKAAIKRVFYIPPSERKYGAEKGYVYFQDFIPLNNFDIRVIVIENKAFAIKRMVRENDFRASGSGMIKYEREHFDPDTIRLALDLAGKLNSQSVAFDFIYYERKPLVVEISYCFTSLGVYEKCEGFWDKDMNWHEGTFNPYGWMVDSLLKDLNQK
ncbi:ATP-grasp domain-containing protein [Cognataquiflexum aquatile]|uniref:ATP-grasp domain-containing protein n=1 Tax=Cognataquiflexum aquatile TaxID=2249427 RepID=UPI000DE82668|nr:hypothetical protein [Cognataquiflexum aquatile]